MDYTGLRPRSGADPRSLTNADRSRTVGALTALRKGLKELPPKVPDFYSRPGTSANSAAPNSAAELPTRCIASPNVSAGSIWSQCRRCGRTWWR